MRMNAVNGIDELATKRKVVMPNFVSAILIEPVTLSRGLDLFLVDARDFNQAAETAEKRGVVQVQVEQDLIVGKFYGPMTQYYRGNIGQFILGTAMWNKIRCMGCPKQSVELVDHVQI